MNAKSVVVATVLSLAILGCGSDREAAVAPEETQEAAPRPAAKNLVSNHSLEELDEKMKPKHWAPTADTVNLVVDAGKAHSGKVAVIASNAAFVSQAITVKGDRDYTLSHYSRTEDGKGAARMQINFIDDSGKIIDVKIDAKASGTKWVQHSYKVRSPATATTAVIFLVPHAGDVWFDDVWFTEGQ